MMKTDITVVLDRSGSMESIASDVIGGLNTFIREQAQVEGEACFTLVQFDDHYEVVHAHVPVQDVPCEPTMVTMAFATAGEGVLPPPTMAKAGCVSARTDAAAAMRMNC